ncbi:hypothetical protein MAUB1S_06368 [Mycolicibacterium aubagnense]
MKLVLTIENSSSFPADLRQSFDLANGKITIGRGSSCDWALPDASRFVSSLHCEIERRGNDFILTDLSRNGLAVGVREFAEGEQVALRNGDIITIGPFSIVASVLSGDPGTDDGATVFMSAPTDATVLRHQVNLDDSSQTMPAQRPQVEKSDNQVDPSAGKIRSFATPADFRSDFVTEFAMGADINPDRLAGRTDAEFARELGGIMRIMVPAMVALLRSDRQMLQVAGHAEAASAPDRLATLTQTKGDVLELLLNASDHDLGGTTELLDRLVNAVKDHQRAMFPALQIALFKLLNDFAPTTIEKQEGSTLLRPRKGRCWDAYSAVWEEHSNSGHNGVLDVLLRYFRDAYDSALIERRH